MSVQKYSKTPSSNVVVNDGADAVSTAEGMARASVNDAIRAMMADIAKYALDHGALTTAGTGSAYTLNTNSQITTLTDGITLTAKAHAASGAGATLNVNALGARPLKLRGTNGLVTAPAGAIKAGDMLVVTYRDNSWVCAGIADYSAVVDDLVTAASILTKLKTVDGAGSGVDADLLDGQHGSYYRNASNLNAGTVPAARLSGSYSINADQVDGLHAASFLRSDAADTATQTVTFQEGVNIGKNGGGDSLVQFYDDNSNAWRSFFWDDSVNDWRIEDNGGAQQKLWHGGNDGAGSGLDADLLDGLQATSFLRTDAANATIIMGTNQATNFDGIKYDEGGNAFNFFADQDADNDTPIFQIDKESGAFVSGSKVWTTSNLNVEGSSGQIMRKLSPRGGAGFGVDDAVILGSGESVTTTASNIDPAAETTFITSDGAVFIHPNMQNGWGAKRTFEFTTDGRLLIGGNPAFHVGNDGSGSGLDADLLDGQQGSFYRSASNLNAGTVPSARLSGSYNISAAQLGGVAAANFYHSGKNNPHVRMGSGNAANWDGWYYDDATNTFYAKADTAKDDTSVGGSKVVAATMQGSTVRATSGTDASLSSTGHGFQVGPSNGVNLIADGNEVMARNNGAASALYLNNDGGSVHMVANAFAVSSSNVAFGGVSLKAPLGNGQTWADKGSSRTAGTFYQNTSGRSIAVAVRGVLSSSEGHSFQVGPNTTSLTNVASTGRNGAWRQNIFTIVPSGWWYRLNAGTYYNWAELS